MTLSEVHGLGLDAAQGLVLTEGFYWGHDDRSRAFSERFFKRTGRMPSMIHAGTYSATLSYLKAVKAAGTRDPEAVAKKLKELPEHCRIFHSAVRHRSLLETDIGVFVRTVEIPVIGRDGEISGVLCRNLPLTSASRSTPLTQSQDTAIIGEATKTILPTSQTCLPLVECISGRLEGKRCFLRGAPSADVLCWPESAAPTGDRRVRFFGRICTEWRGPD
jgi:hypothetical protein